jgi:hypothetical protein
MKKIFFLGAIMVLALAGCANTSKVKNLTLEEAKVKATKFIEENMVQPGTTISVKEMIDDGDLYKIVINLPNGQDYTSYISKDGSKFFPQGVDLTAFANEKEKQTAQNTQSSDIPKTDKPVVELYVMAFCPYGIQAEDIILPVFNLLGDKADIKPRFIVDLESDNLKDIKSLHGVVEGYEDARQLCVAKNYDSKKLWDYISNINDDCSKLYSKGDAAYDPCWKKAAKDAGVDAAKIQSCINTQAVELIKAESKVSSDNGVSGSPTLIINGVKYNGARSADGFKEAICAAFNTQPEECSQTLGDAGAAAPTGGCE